jgi:5-methylcytosine-specific restriction endonuclease McrA
MYGEDPGNKRIRGGKGQEIRKRRLTLSNGLCQRCNGTGRWIGRGLGRTTAASIVNHIIPLAHGGPDEDDNTENLCRPCDLVVTAEQFNHKQRVQIGEDGWPVS